MRFAREKYLNRLIAGQRNGLVKIVADKNVSLRESQRQDKWFIESNTPSLIYQAARPHSSAAFHSPFSA